MHYLSFFLIYNDDSKDARFLQLKSDVKEDIAAEKLVYDTSTNRFYESVIEAQPEALDEYFVTDKESG